LNKKTLTDLGYFQVIDILKGFAQSEPGVRACGELRPYSDFDTALKEAARLTQFLKLLNETDISLAGVTDIRDALYMAKIKNSTLGIENIADIKENLILAKNLKSTLRGLDEDEYCYLVEYDLRLHDLNPLIKHIKRTIGIKGEILDSASDQLRSIRRELKHKREEIISSLTNIMMSKGNAPIIQDEVITTRNDRYVLIVKPNYNEYFKGIIHGDSNSGASYFVEPFSSVEENNKLNLLIQEEKEEELNILKEITSLVRDDYEYIVENLDTLLEFDFLYAKARLSKALNASEALLNNHQDGGIDLRNARHPLLYFDSKYNDTNEGAKVDDVIPINIKFTDNNRGMVISGANSGGKTATLKTLGLLSLMAKSGLHISAETGSALTFFDRIYADIGDDQDILNSNGTFSSHLRNIKEILDDTDDNTLVLIDELGTGTNPSEGSALFSALMDYLLEKGCFFVATTHLDKIKHYAYINSNVENVSVAFNDETLKPEYRLIYNQIGQSNAINLAKQIGFNKDILKKAEGYLTSDELKLSELINDLTRERARLDDEKEKAALHLREAKALKVKRERTLTKLKEKRELIIKNKEKEVSDLFYDTKKKLKEIIKSQKEESANDIQSFEEITVLRKKVKKKFILPKRSGGSTKIFDVDEKVYVDSLKKHGTISKIDNAKNTALINIGSLKIDIPVGELTKCKYNVNKREGNVTISKNESSSVSHKINIIGKTVDEALPIVDRFLDEAYLSNLREVTIIHGKGTGRLRVGIMKHLKDAPYVAGIVDSKDIIAAAGATTVKIKE
jgi:DNA mismatch repair protein MutS2